MLSSVWHSKHSTLTRFQMLTGGNLRGGQITEHVNEMMFALSAFATEHSWQLSRLHPPREATLRLPHRVFAPQSKKPMASECNLCKKVALEPFSQSLLVKTRPAPASACRQSPLSEIAMHIRAAARFWHMATQSTSARDQHELNVLPRLPGHQARKVGVVDFESTKLRDVCEASWKLSSEVSIVDEVELQQTGEASTTVLEAVQVVVVCLDVPQGRCVLEAIKRQAAIDIVVGDIQAGELWHGLPILDRQWACDVVVAQHQPPQL